MSHRKVLYIKFDWNQFVFEEKRSFLENGQKLWKILYGGAILAPPPHITDLISQPGHPGQPGVFIFPVLLLKVAKINFRKSQVESTRVVFQNFEYRQFSMWGGP